MKRKEHWNGVYQASAPDDVSWYQSRPELSLALIAASKVQKDGGIIDVGGGASSLVDYLLASGYTHLSVLDLSAVALIHARSRLGPLATSVEWIESDVTVFQPTHRFALWHDRAVFHFLTGAHERQQYVNALQRSLKAEGDVIMATFAPDGPATCSGLEVVRYDDQSIAAELGPQFALREVRRESHITPWKSEQRFTYFRFKKLPD